MDEGKIEKSKRKRTTIVFTIITVIVMLVLIVAFLQMNQMEPLPFSMMAILIGIPVLVIIGVVYACRERLSEIERGEWDEARKY